jgi:hypothetical protein
MKSLSQKLNESLNEDSKITVFTDAKLTKKTSMNGGDIFDAQILKSDKDVTEIHTYPPNQKTFYILTKDAYAHNIIESVASDWNDLTIVQKNKIFNELKIKGYSVKDSFSDYSQKHQDLINRYLRDNDVSESSEEQVDENSNPTRVTEKDLKKGFQFTYYVHANKKQINTVVDVKHNMVIYKDGPSGHDVQVPIDAIVNSALTIDHISESVEPITEAKITSDEDFIKYGETVLKKAHGDNYDQAKADKTLKGILKDADGDYGAAVGALTNGLKEEGEAEDTVDESAISSEKFLELYPTKPVGGSDRIAYDNDFDRLSANDKKTVEDKHKK